MGQLSNRTSCLKIRYRDIRVGSRIFDEVDAQRDRRVTRIEVEEQEVVRVIVRRCEIERAVSTRLENEIPEYSILIQEFRVLGAIHHISRNHDGVRRVVRHDHAVSRVEGRADRLPTARSDVDNRGRLIRVGHEHFSKTPQAQA